MKSIQIILNAVLSKNTFEYILIDRKLHIESMSDGVVLFLGKKPNTGDDILEYLPELVGSENDIDDIFDNTALTFILESVHINSYYINISIEHYDSSTALVLMHNITDITLSKQKLLQYSNESTLLNNTLQKILDRQNALLFVTNNEEISFANEQFLDYFGVKRIEDLRRHNLKIFTYMDVELKSYDALFERVNSKEEYVVIGADTFILQATPIESTHKLFTLNKVTNLSNEIQTDPLTGIYRKSYFNTQIEKMIKEGKEGVLVVVDLDDFKKINDTYGHQVGDDVLKEFTKLLKSNIRGNDVLARWGGEEFLLLLQNTNIENALRKVENLREQVASHDFKHIGHLCASFGVSWKEEEDDLHSLLHRADKALYEAKAEGKNRVVFKKYEKV